MNHHIQRSLQLQGLIASREPTSVPVALHYLGEQRVKPYALIEERARRRYEALMKAIAADEPMETIMDEYCRFCVSFGLSSSESTFSNMFCRYAPFSPHVEVFLYFHQRQGRSDLFNIPKNDIMRYALRLTYHAQMSSDLLQFLLDLGYFWSHPHDSYNVSSLVVVAGSYSTLAEVEEDEGDFIIDEDEGSIRDPVQALRLQCFTVRFLRFVYSHGLQCDFESLFSCSSHLSVPAIYTAFEQGLWPPLDITRKIATCFEGQWTECSLLHRQRMLQFCFDNELKLDNDIFSGFCLTLLDYERQKIFFMSRLRAATTTDLFSSGWDLSRAAKLRVSIEFIRNQINTIVNLLELVLNSSYSFFPMHYRMSDANDDYQNIVCFVDEGRTVDFNCIYSVLNEYCDRMYKLQVNNNPQFCKVLDMFINSNELDPQPNTNNIFQSRFPILSELYTKTSLYKDRLVKICEELTPLSSDVVKHVLVKFLVPS